MLKLDGMFNYQRVWHAAAFGRLCVETYITSLNELKVQQPPSGGCVLKQHADEVAEVVIYAAAFGRLCVETFVYIDNQTSL